MLREASLPADKRIQYVDVIRRSGARMVLAEQGFLDREYTAEVPVIDLASEFLSSGEPFEAEMLGTDSGKPRRNLRRRKL